ncbi:hypothetical protein [Actinokineospora iranica]|uniref:Ribbon-helix-helix protein, copG family n=1 Tax=Actinokineospora iranica TaxID=1271860 RepID=A0A1G6JYB4_9PSEU|nr:hypothetical protein [Actinokineospora iranica]SDC23693.1 hypothetical protein SAMN05216174_101618 [Actinokineospora iranica]
MDLTPYVDRLGRELMTLVETGGDDPRVLTERLGASLDSAIRLALLDALSAAADEITRDLVPGSVEVRLRGRDPNFAVTPPPADQPVADPVEPAAAPEIGGTEEGATARINLRLPEQLKAAIEEAAGREGRSANAWLVRVASAALRRPTGDQTPERPGKRGPQRFTGWAR